MAAFGGAVAIHAAVGVAAIAAVEAVGTNSVRGTWLGHHGAAWRATRLARRRQRPPPGRARAEPVAHRAGAHVDQARSLATELRTWRALRRQSLAGHQQRFHALEAAAHLIRVFQPALVPGLLQTAEYARQVFLRSGLAGTPAEIAEVAAAVRARLDRQAAL